jgi:hypothetical protein
MQVMLTAAKPRTAFVNAPRSQTLHSGESETFQGDAPASLEPFPATPLLQAEEITVVGVTVLPGKLAFLRPGRQPSPTSRKAAFLDVGGSAAVTVLPDLFPDGGSTPAGLVPPLEVFSPPGTPGPNGSPASAGRRVAGSGADGAVAVRGRSDSAAVSSERRERFLAMRQSRSGREVGARGDSPRSRSRRKLSDLYSSPGGRSRSPYCCEECIGDRRELAEEVEVKGDIRRRVVEDGGHRALLVLSQAWWHPATEYAYNAAGQAQLAGEAELLQSLSLHGLASLAISAANACQLVAEGALPILVGLLDPDGPPPRPSLSVLRSSTRALANIACSSRHGTLQCQGIGHEIFETEALPALLKLTTHGDLEVVRHVSRTLAELVRICVMPDDVGRDGLSAVRTPTSASRIPPSRRNSARAASWGNSYRADSYRSSGSASWQSLAQPLSKGSKGLWSFFKKGERTSIGPGGSDGSMGAGLTDAAIEELQVVLPNICQGSTDIQWLCKMTSRCFRRTAAEDSVHDAVVQRHCATIFAKLVGLAARWLDSASGNEEVVPALTVLAASTEAAPRFQARFALAGLAKSETFRKQMVTHRPFATAVFGPVTDGVAPELSQDASLTQTESSRSAEAKAELDEDRLTAMTARYLSSDTAARTADSGLDFVAIATRLARKQQDDASVLNHLSSVLRHCASDEEEAQRLLDHQDFEAAVERLLNLAMASEPEQMTNGALALAQLSLLPAAAPKLKQRGAIKALLTAFKAGEQYADDGAGWSSASKQKVLDAIERLNDVADDGQIGSPTSPSNRVDLTSLRQSAAAGEPEAPSAAERAEEAANKSLKSKGVAVMDNEEWKAITTEGRISSGQFGDVYKVIFY